MMVHEENSELPVVLESLRQEAKRLRRESAHQQSYEKNEQLVQESIRLRCELGEVLGLRFMGVCKYRLGCFEKSHELLVQARERACAAKLHQQELYIANHLGATLRHLRDFDGAYEAFRNALDRVRLPQDLEARARLLGSLGAFYDEIGNLAGADDCYARYEELVELIVKSGKTDDLPRLANARAFAGRTAMRRGDLDSAKLKYDDEYEIAKNSNDRLRMSDAIFHRAKIHLALGLRNNEYGHFDEAAARFEEAHQRYQKDNHRSRIADVLHHRARLDEARGQWPAAYEGWLQSWKNSVECKQLYRQAQSSLALARFCQRWALHGESLYWFGQAARIRLDQYLPFQKSGRIAGMVQSRRDELQDVAEKLARESRCVDREKDELGEIDRLVHEMTGKTIKTLAIVSDSEPVLEWQKRVRGESLERWQELLSPEKFAQLKPQSRSDLVMADVLYHGVVDELPRAALLLAIVVERELRERLFIPLYQSYWSMGGRKRKRVGLDSPPTMWYLNQGREDNIPIGSALKIVSEILNAPAKNEEAKFAQEHLRIWRVQLQAIKRLSEVIEPFTGATSRLRLAQLRNEAAHGGDGVTKIDRITVDAMKRRLFLESPMILASILEMDVSRSAR